MLGRPKQGLLEQGHLELVRGGMEWAEMLDKRQPRERESQGSEGECHEEACFFYKYLQQGTIPLPQLGQPKMCADLAHYLLIEKHLFE